MKVVFMGTPDFAVSALRALVEAGHEVVLVVTQPDKEKGRGKLVSKSDVKIFAEENNLPVYQPVRIRNEEAVEYLRGIEADIFVVAAFGQILPKSILEMPKYGCINIHGSLLPKYRGAAPIQWSVINGDEYTGVTIMQMAEGLDTGDILMTEKIRIEDSDTGGSLFDKLSLLGGSLLIKCLEAIEKGEVVPVPQREEESCYAKMLSKEMGLLDFTRPASCLWRLIRGCNPWPGTYTHINGKTLKIWAAEPIDYAGEIKPGTVLETGRDYFLIGCGENALKVKEVQLEGKKRMTAHDFLLGYKLTVGDRLE